MTQVGHTCCTRVERCIFCLVNDFIGFAASLHVRCFCLHAFSFAFGLPHWIFWEGAELDIDEGLLVVARNQLFRKFRLCGKALFNFGKPSFIRRDFFGDNLRDFHALIGTEHVFQISNRCRLAIGIRKAITQLVRQFAQQFQIIGADDGMVTFNKDAHKIVITESFLKLVRFDKHRVAFDKVTIPWSFDINLFHAHDRNCK